LIEIRYDHDKIEKSFPPFSQAAAAHNEHLLL
jgi:hypothetical protein